MTRETEFFLSDPRHVRLDTEAKILFLSSIFEWYENDFVRWLKCNARGDSEAEHSLRAYLALHLPAREAEAIRSCADCRIEFMPYDWSLNDRSARIK